MGSCSLSLPREGKWKEELTVCEALSLFSPSGPDIYVSYQLLLRPLQTTGLRILFILFTLCFLFQLTHKAQNWTYYQNDLFIYCSFTLQWVCFLSVITYSETQQSSKYYLMQKYAWNEVEGNNIVYSLLSFWEPELPTFILTSVMDLCCLPVTNWISVQLQRWVCYFCSWHLSHPWQTLVTFPKYKDHSYLLDLTCVHWELTSSCGQPSRFIHVWPQTPKDKFCISEQASWNTLWPFQLHVDGCIMFSPLHSSVSHGMSYV